MVIEKMRMKDLEQVQELQWSLAPFGRTREEAEKLYRDMLEDEDYCLVVAREGDTVLGTATGVCCRVLSGDFLVVEDVVVRDEARGTGIGRQMMEALDEFAKERNCLYAILVSSGYRTQAHAFYEKLGFTEDVRGFRKGYRDDWHV